MTGIVNANDVETTVLSWGVAKWLVSQKTHGSTLSCGEVVVLPGKSHEWHDHPDSDEIVYVLSGHGSFGVGENLRMPIGPGDAVYIPPLWWHHVASQRPLNLLINFWWRAPQAASGLDALLHTLMALRDLPEAERAAWRTLFEHWVFGATPERFAHLPPGLRGLHDGAGPEQAAAVRALLRNKLGA